MCRLHGRGTVNIRFFSLLPLLTFLTWTLNLVMTGCVAVPAEVIKPRFWNGGIESARWQDEWLVGGKPR